MDNKACGTITNQWIHTVKGFPAYHARVRLTVVARSSSTDAADVCFPEFLVSLNKVVKVLVKRVSKPRSKEAKEKVAEVLVLEGIKYCMNKFLQFDMYVND